MNIEESVEEVDRVIDQLTDKNKTVPIIVEGKKDTKTLRKLGLNGIIIELNKGLSLVSIPTFFKIALMLGSSFALSLDPAESLERAM